MPFYHIGERKERPGVYLRIVNRGTVSYAPAYPPVTPPAPPDETEGITVAYDGRGLVTLSIPRGTVSYDDNGIVTLSIPDCTVSYDGNGTVTIGG